MINQNEITTDTSYRIANKWYYLKTYVFRNNIVNELLKTQIKSKYFLIFVINTKLFYRIFIFYC